MPPLMFAVPVINRSDPPYAGKGKAPARSFANPRKYNNEPLPIKLSDYAPKNAQIVSRALTGVTYQLKIGDVELDDIGLDEILDYVSPLDLEAFENARFAEEREFLAGLEADKQAQRIEKLEHQRERAKRKGVVAFEEVDSTDDVTGAEDVQAESHGRARPNYTHLFKLPKERRRRKRDPKTGELLPLSGIEDDENVEDDQAGVSTEYDSAPVPRNSGPFMQLSKRRRRKRDKETGELLPLTPVKIPLTGMDTEQKRKRRRRHPLTGELMPIGWRFNPDDEDDDVPSEKVEGVSFRNLSISQEHEAKRPRLELESSMSRSVSPPPKKKTESAVKQPAKHSPNIPHFSTTPRGFPLVDLTTSDDEEIVRSRDRGASPALKSFLASNAIRPANALFKESTSPRKSYPENALRTSTSRLSTSSKSPPAPPVSRLAKYTPTSLHRTSILQPSASQRSPVVSFSDTEDSQDVEEEDEVEWRAEAILSHQYSDPRTHPSALDTRPVMLYETKWANSDTLRWEPLDSFGDRSIVRNYRRRAGLPSEPSDAGSEDEEDDDEDEEMDEDEYEIEFIAAHHLSDPRTHPPKLGKTPVMLYQVKWKGWEEKTWEPAESFTNDSGIIDAYRKRVGIGSV